MTLKDKIHEQIKFYSTKLEQNADRIWYAPLLALLAALDSLIIIIPNDGILVASSMVVPKRWAIFGLFVAIGSTIGALALSALVEHQGLPWVLDLYPGIDKTQIWSWCDEFFNKYGLLMVFAVGVTPLTQQPVVILAALANTPMLGLAGALLAGRLIKFLLMAYAGSHSPKLLKKMWGIKDELKDVGVKID